MTSQNFRIRIAIPPYEIFSVIFMKEQAMNKLDNLFSSASLDKHHNLLSNGYVNVEVKIFGHKKDR